jgi:hypothetical protein
MRELVPQFRASPRDWVEQALSILLGVLDDQKREELASLLDEILVALRSSPSD